MDIFTFGIILIAATGGSLIALSVLESAGVSINNELISLVMACIQYGGILYFFKVIVGLFL